MALALLIFGVTLIAFYIGAWWGERQARRELRDRLEAWGNRDELFRRQQGLVD